MAAESEPNQSKPKTFENGWIVCRSQKRPGLLYDFNTLTGEAQWRDPDKSAHHTAIVDKNKVPFECHEPTEPPMEPKIRKQSKQGSPAPNIYNKQIINNQFPAKPFALAPFGNSVCASYSLIDPNNVNTMNAAPVWVGPTTPQVILGPSPLNPLFTYGAIENVQFQNSSLTLSNRFQVLNQLNTECPIGMNLRGEGTSNHESYSHQQPHQNHKPWHQRHQRPANKNLHMHADLRSKLSSRKRQDLKAHDANVAVQPEIKKEDASVIVTEDELNPDDDDEWLKAHTDGEGRELNMDIESFWELADICTSRDCCYIIPTTRVLLNNMRFLTSLVISDNRLRLLTPRDVVRTLRCAAFSSNGRLADYASRARTFAIRQMRKFPDNVKDAPNVKACLELIAPNIHVVRLVDEKDMINQEGINDGTITVSELKQYLTRNSTPKSAPVPKMQTICEKIKITVPNAKDKPESSTRVVEPRIQVEESLESSSICNSTTNSTTVESPRPDTEKTGQKEIEIQTNLPSPPGKRTANACVQTDLVFTTPTFEINPNKNKTSEAVNTNEELSDKQTNLNFTLSEIGHKEIKASAIEDTDAAPNNDKATTAAPRKIRLKRLQNSNTSANTEEKKPFKWRKRKNTQQATVVEHEQGSLNSNINTSSSTSHLTQENNDSLDNCKFSDVSAEEKVDESFTSGVISNSIDSEKQSIQNELNTDQSIVVYEVTSDSMADRLILRSDEWMSRFVQVMEEVLSQVLLLDPSFNDATLPPPWTFYEATVCVRRKFAKERKIVYAAEKLAMFLLKNNDDRGNIVTKLSPTDFMEMYTFGVNLVNKLQSVLNDCEDVHIACQTLSHLLNDIREPNLDESCDMETFNYDEPNHSPNFSEAVTDMSTIISGFPPMSVNNKSRNKEKSQSCSNSPARYSLRSGRSEQKKQEEEQTQTNAVCHENKKYTLFSSLGLQKREIKVDSKITKTISNYPKDQQPKSLSPLTPTLEVSEISQGPKPKIVRNFNVCPEFEIKLKDKICSNATDNNVDNDSLEVECVAENFMPENVGFAEDVDFSKDSFTNDNFFYYEGAMSETTKMNVDLNYTYIQPPNADCKLKQVLRRITYKYRRWLIDLQTFCEATNATLKSPDYQQQDYKANMIEKITQVGEHANSVCHRLKCILKRDPSVTSNKFRDMLKSYGFIDFNMSDTQVTDYREEIAKYLELAERLLTCVSRLVEAVKAK
ncbi:uncharacterized protein LOC133516007 isoform X2 [Cydia pomonella]|uniref:uncharacterized protein LOC133516007 isoform X2 n=1 Tax=Cydia pomonella TaxID=82600 RepID=UPI002ADD4230|nr:uncharacterized protein LOC133516007 isoform X2 [Cydia pomonella]